MPYIEGLELITIYKYGVAGIKNQEGYVRRMDGRGFSSIEK